MIKEYLKNKSILEKHIRHDYPITWISVIVLILFTISLFISGMQLGIFFGSRNQQKQTYALKSGSGQQIEFQESKIIIHFSPCELLIRKHFSETEGS